MEGMDTFSSLDYRYLLSSLLAFLPRGTTVPRLPECVSKLVLSLDGNGKHSIARLLSYACEGRMH